MLGAPQAMRPRSSALRVRMTVAVLVVCGASMAGSSFGSASHMGRSAPPVNIADVRALPCMRESTATAIMAFAAILSEARWRDASLLWPAKPRRPYPGLQFFLYRYPEGTGYIRARERAAIPQAVELWLDDRYSKLEVIQIDARINEELGVANFSLHWIRLDPRGTPAPVIFGRGKGSWDCDARGFARWVGNEKLVASEVRARALVAGRCGQRSGSKLRRYGQTALICEPPQRSRSRG